MIHKGIAKEEIGMECLNFEQSMKKGLIESYDNGIPLWLSKTKIRCLPCNRPILIKTKEKKSSFGWEGGSPKNIEIY